MGVGRLINGLMLTSVRALTVSGIGTYPSCHGLPVSLPSVKITNTFGTSLRSPPVSENN